MSLVEQVQSLLAAAAQSDQSLADQASRIEALSQQITTLSAENAALRERLESPQSPPVTEWGFVANETDPAAAFAPALKTMKADGGDWLRLWHSSFGTISAATAALITLAAAIGVKVILCVQPKDGEARNLGSPDFAGFVTKNAAILKKVTFVEAGNELNLTQFRPDDLGGNSDWHKAYVARWLRPMAAALSAVGVKTLCTSITDTYNPENYRPNYDALLAAGAGDCCDGVALQAYFLPEKLQTLSDILGHVSQTWKKPVHITECNVLTKGLTPALWNQRFPDYLAVLVRANVASVQFYRGFAKANGKWPWPTLFDKDGQATDVYSVLKAGMKK
ncbi:MAG: hypothetical protein QM754_10060 [Tepidisphaeraceae bacterium]